MIKHYPHIVLCLSIILLAGCPKPDPVSPQRDSARAGLLLIAKAGVIADNACSELTKAKNDAAIAKTCADAYDNVRSSLLIAESSLEAWGPSEGASPAAGGINQVACATKSAVEALSLVSKVIVDAGGKLSPTLIDALKFSTLFTSQCRQVAAQ